MEALPDLDRLSVGEKDDLVRALFAQAQVLLAQVDVLTGRVTELEGRLALNSQNSSKPPFSDGLGRPKPKSRRQKELNSTGGQKGHQGHTLKKVAQPDHIEPHLPPSQCDACHRPLPDAVVVETRQVFDIPPLRHEVTEHRSSKRVVLAASCIGVSFPQKLRRRCSTGRASRQPWCI